MKSILRISAVLIILQLAACKDDNNEKSEHELKTDMLTASSWGHAQVTHSPDGDLSSQYKNFVIVFTKVDDGGFDGTYLISNGGYAFSENIGKWKLNDSLNQISFDTGKVMDVQLDESHLQLDFTTTLTGGRVAGLSGHFVFDLKPL